MLPWESSVAFARENMAAGSKLGWWEWREVRRLKSNFDGRDRKNAAVRREIYVWKSHYNINTRPSVQMKISGQQPSMEFPLIHELNANWTPTYAYINV